MTNASPPHNRLFLLYCSSALRRPQFWRPNPCSQLRRSISQSHGQDLGHYAGYLYRPSAGPSAESIIRALHQAAVARPTWNSSAVQPERLGRGSPTTTITAVRKGVHRDRPESCRSRSFTLVRRNELYSVAIPGRTLYCVMKRNRCA
jgi:hypothetical protein